MDGHRKVIMLVDDNLSNLKVGKTALADIYDVFTAISAGKMLELLESIAPELILLDVMMPDMNGYEAITVLKNRMETRDIPVIFLTAKSDGESELKGLELGAIDYISKPFSVPLLRKRIEVHLLVEAQKKTLLHYNQNLQKMVAAKTHTVLKMQNKILKTVADLVGFRDTSTGSHIERTQRCLVVLLSALIDDPGYAGQTTGWDVELLQQSSMLHDVGKISISDTILQKPGPLTAEEFSEMKKHAACGVRIIEKIEGDDTDSEFLSYSKIFAGTHHEKWDGSGYPNSLRDTQIPLLGRLMAIADVYEALTSERPYKKPVSCAEAVDIITRGRGSHFDPYLVDLFVKVADQF